MKTIVIGLASLVLSLQAMAQQAASGNAPPDKTSATLEYVLASIKEKTYTSDSQNDYCAMSASKALHPGTLVVLVRRGSCRTSKPYVEVAYKGETRYVDESALSLTKEGVQRLNTVSDDDAAANHTAWEKDSLRIHHLQLLHAKAELDRGKSAGVSVLRSSIFDTSEYTEGTGFKATVFNTGKKTIKYATFTVVGLNAVGDTVRDRLRGGTSMVLKGIGPVEPGESAGWSKDYMWSTDLVESHRVVSIRLEFMDGTSRTIGNIDKLTLSSTTLAVLENE